MCRSGTENKIYIENDHSVEFEIIQLFSRLSTIGDESPSWIGACASIVYCVLSIIRLATLLELTAEAARASADEPVPCCFQVLRCTLME